MPKIIAKPIFQILALCLLLLAALLTTYWVMMEAGLYQWINRWLDLPILSAAFTLIANLLGVLLVLVILRPFVQGLPTLKDQLQKEADFLKAPGSLETKLAAARAESANQLSPRMLGLVLFILGLFVGLIALGSLWVTDGDIYVFQIVLGLLGLGLCGGGALQLMLGKRLF